MGAKITVDSASMFNKALEIMEARWLFDMPAEKIQVVVHPQSILHSAVEFEDGAVIGQMGTPDMRLPILYAMSYPERLPTGGAALDLFALGTLTFEKGDPERFPALRLAGECLRAGGAAAPCSTGPMRRRWPPFCGRRFPLAPSRDWWKARWRPCRGCPPQPWKKFSRRIRPRGERWTLSCAA